MRDFPLSPTPNPMPIQDSSAIYRKQGNKAAKEMANAMTPVAASIASNKIAQATKNEKRQALKGKPGYDAMGFKKP